MGSLTQGSNAIPLGPGCTVARLTPLANKPTPRVREEIFVKRNGLNTRVDILLHIKKLSKNLTT